MNVTSVSLRTMHWTWSDTDVCAVAYVVSSTLFVVVWNASCAPPHFSNEIVLHHNNNNNSHCITSQYMQFLYDFSRFVVGFLKWRPHTQMILLYRLQFFLSPLLYLLRRLKYHDDLKLTSKKHTTKGTNNKKNV